MRLLRPLVRLLLRHAVPYGAFDTLARRVYVETALRDFALPGKKPSVSRASILTGLTRKEVQRLVAEDPLVFPTDDMYSRLNGYRVLDEQEQQTWDDLFLPIVEG